MENEQLSEIKAEMQSKFDVEEQARGIGWKIYFVIFILFRILWFFEKLNPVSAIFGVLHLVLSTLVLYSWIWARPIGWLSSIRWLVKVWSIQFFIAPIALVFYGYFALTKDDPGAIGWVVAIVIQYPALYAVYRIAWKSRLLYKPAKE
jgi:hypothetical protein